jgi:hypothetical protein
VTPLDRKGPLRFGAASHNHIDAAADFTVTARQFAARYGGSSLLYRADAKGRYHRRPTATSEEAKALCEAHYARQ